MIIGIIIIILIVLVFAYNNLISRKNQVANAFAGTDALLKKRYDLIPNLVSTVKGYAEHEKEVFNKVTELRSKAVSEQASDEEKINIDNQISAAISKIRMVAENYPDLKASENFLQLQAALNEVEEQISAGRRAYNAAVVEYNNAVQMFPTSIIANLMGFKSMKMFEINSDQRESKDWYTENK